VLEIAGVKVSHQPVLDGVSLTPLFAGKMQERPRPLGFLLWTGKGNLAQSDFVKDTQAVWIDGKHKLVINPAGTAALYDIYADPQHKSSLAEREPETVQRLRSALDDWRRSVQASHAGKDFP
jgi:hypothetical protein